MRTSRLRKFKTRKKLKLTSKLLITCYILIFSFGYLTSGTGAYFNTVSNDKQVIQAGKWWDGSELVFMGTNTQNVKACPPVEIAVEIKNKGFSMIDPNEYEVYYAKNGNPKNRGEKIASGTIEPVTEGELVSLTFEAEQQGSYMFKVIQHPNYDGDNQDPWSEKVMVKCIDTQPVKANEQNGKTGETENKSDKKSNTDETNEVEHENQEDTAAPGEQVEMDDERNQEIGKGQQEVDASDRNKEETEKNQTDANDKADGGTNNTKDVNKPSEPEEHGEDEGDEE